MYICNSVYFRVSINYMYNTISLSSLPPPLPPLPPLPPPSPPLPLSLSLPALPNKVKYLTGSMLNSYMEL